jgi:Asp-tRNA(Asn)/Glu-tRNA(Gln) amidotransferase A subunit family amidase
MKDLCYLSASELSKGISTGDILSEDLVKSYIGRIKKFDKTIKAWAHFDVVHPLGLADTLRMIAK